MRRIQQVSWIKTTDAADLERILAAADFDEPRQVTAATNLRIRMEMIDRKIPQTREFIVARVKEINPAWDRARAAINAVLKPMIEVAHRDLFAAAKEQVNAVVAAIAPNHLAEVPETREEYQTVIQSERVAFADYIARNSLVYGQLLGLDPDNSINEWGAVVVVIDRARRTVANWSKIARIRELFFEGADNSLRLNMEAVAKIKSAELIK